MIHKMDRRAITFGLTLALFLAWSGVAHSQFYTVHQTTVRIKVAFEDCEGEGECRIRYQLLNPARFTRLLCGISDDERIPQGFTLATFISCDRFPDAMISVWDKRNEEHVCGSLDLSVFVGTFEDSAGHRGKAEFLFSTEEGPPLFATALARYAPLPRRLEMDQICWNTFRTHSVAGALDPGTVIMEGRLRAGAPIAVYGEE